MKRTIIGLSVGGGFVIALGAILGWVVLPHVFESTVKKETLIVEGSTLYPIWEEAPIPVNMKFWIFNILNQDEVLQGKKPILEEIGPFAYREMRKKFNIQKFDNEDLIRYKELKTFFYEPSLSNGNTEEQKVTTINLIYVSIAKIIEDALANTNEYIVNSVWNFLNSRFESIGEGLLMERTVAELLYNGWDISPYLKIIQDLCSQQFISTLCNSLGAGDILEELGKNPYFGLFSRNNNSDEGEFAVGTGYSNYMYTGKIMSWKEDYLLPYWDRPWDEGNYCNMINGTDGTRFHPFIEEHERIYIYQADLCRSVFLEYERDTTYKGINVKRFVLSPNVGESALIYPENICFCSNISDTSTCLQAPATPVDRCQYGAPIVGSTAHFFDGDGYYLGLLEGLSTPNISHQTYAEIEPITGAPFSAAKRAQVNIDLQAYGRLEQLQNISSKIIFPMLWFEEGADLPDEIIEAYRKEVLVPLQAIEGVRWALVSLGILLVLAAIFIFIFKRN